MNIPQTGPNPAKAKFFREVAAAFEFLEIFYQLTVEQQNEIQVTMIKMQNRVES